MKKISSLFIALLFIFVAQSVQADYIQIDIPIAIRNQQFFVDYLKVPISPLDGIPFHFPGVEGNQNNDFFAFNDFTGNTMTMPVTGVTLTTKAYLLLNTNWGTVGKAGTVTFYSNIPGDSWSITLTGGYNIRDWNSSGGYTDSLTADNATANVFSVTLDSYGAPGRIDMLTVDLGALLQPDEFLTSIVFTDSGSDESSPTRSKIASRIRVEGVTIDGTSVPVPEPSTLLLFAIGLCVLVVVRTRFNKA
jgi:hypothetical protein